MTHINTVHGTEDIYERLFGRIDFACPICGESGNHVCVQGFQALMEMDDMFAAAVAKTYYQLKYADLLTISLEDMIDMIEEETNGAESEAISNQESSRADGGKKPGKGCKCTGKCRCRTVRKKPYKAKK